MQLISPLKRVEIEILEIKTQGGNDEIPLPCLDRVCDTGCRVQR